MILTKPKLYAQERLDLEDLKALFSGIAADSKFFIKEFWSPGQYVMKGFSVSGLGGPSPALINMTDATLINASNSGEFSYFCADLGANPITATLTPNSRNFLELVLTTQDGTPLTRAFWDPTALGGLGAEFNQTVQTVTNISMTVVSLAGGFSGSANSVPLAIVDTDSGNNIKTIIDQRPLFYRLATPTNAQSGYIWASQTEPELTLNLTSVSGTFQANEPVTIGSVNAICTTGGTTQIGVILPSSFAFAPGNTVTGTLSGATGTLSSAISQFTGADKSITNLRDVISALQTEIKTLKGTRFWFETPIGTIPSVLSLLNALFVPSASSDRASVAWDGNNMSLTDSNAAPSSSDTIALIRTFGSPVNYNLNRQDGTGGSTTIAIPDGSVVYVKFPASGSRTYSGVGALDTNFQVTNRQNFVNNDKNYWIAYREGSKLILRAYGELNVDESAMIGLMTFDRNISLVRGGKWSLATNLLSWDADAFVQIPGLAENRNRIPAGSKTLASDGDCAWVNLNRVPGSPASLTVNVGNIAAIPSGENTLIIARKIGASVLVGSSMILVSGETRTLNTSLSDETLELIGGTTTPIDQTTSDIQLLARGGSDRLINTSDSILDALATISAQIDKFFGQLEIIPDITAPSAEVVITAPDATMLRGETRSQTIGTKLLSMNATRINFQNGHVNEIDDSTFRGVNFSPVIPAAGRYRWVAIGIASSGTNPDNTVTGEVIVSFALADGASPSAAPKASFQAQTGTGGTITNLGQVLLTSTDGINVSPINYANIVQLGVGSGGGGSGGGTGDIVSLTPKGRAFVYTDDSKDPFNCTPPTVVDGVTQILLNFDILTTDYVEVLIDGDYIPLFINASTMAGPYYRTTASNIIHLDRDYHLDSPAKTIEIRTFGSAPPVFPTPSLLAGLDLKGRAFAYTDGVGTPSNVTSTAPVAGVTTIVTTLDIRKSDILMVYIDGDYYPLYISDAVTPDKSYQLIGNNTIQLNADLSGSHLAIDIQQFQGQSFIDDLGNMVITLKAKVDAIYLRSPDTQVWALGIDNSGELDPDSGVAGAVDALRLARDGDSVLCAIEINNDGTLVVDDAPSPGVTVDVLHIMSDNGMVWRINIDESNQLYVTDGDGNKSVIKNDLGDVIWQVNESVEGAVEYLRSYASFADLPNPPILVAGTIPKAFYFDPVSNRDLEAIYTQGLWRPIALVEQGPINIPYGIGDTVTSILTQAQMDSLYGTGKVVIVKGQNIAGSKLSQLTGILQLPDPRGTVLRAKNNGRSDGLGNPDGDLPLGAYQADQNQAHTHVYGALYSLINRDAPIHFETRIDLSWNVTANTLSSGGNEARGRSTTWNVFIRIN